MASEAKVVFVDDSEPVDLDALDPAERVLIAAGLADTDNGHWIDHAVIKADIAAMPAEIEAR